MSATDSTLFRVVVQVTPTPTHPQFGKWARAALNVWLFDTSAELARGRAIAIVGWLPYDIIGPIDNSVTVAPSSESPRMPEIGNGELLAGILGFAMNAEVVPAANPEEGLSRQMDQRGRS